MARKQGYEVGFGKPPKANQFKPGQSGNPKGRPRGTKNLATDLREELLERIPVTVDGVPRKITKQRALIKSIFGKAAKGDPRAALTLIRLIQSIEPSQAPAPETEALSAEDEAILEHFLQRQSDPNTPDSESGTGGSP